MAGGQSGRVRLAGMCAAALCALCWLAAAVAAPLDDWRADIARTRQLADNDGPTAYEQALRLLASLPPDASPVDRARALNLLARTEIHTAQTERSAERAREALELATRHGDKVGQPRPTSTPR